MRCLSTEQNKCFHLLDSLILYATSLSLLTAVPVKANSIRVSVYRRNKHTTPFPYNQHLDKKKCYRSVKPNYKKNVKYLNSSNS